MTERRFKLHLTFDVNISDITRETWEAYISQFANAAEIARDPWVWECSQKQRRLLHALMEDEAALRRFIAAAVVDDLYGPSALEELPDLLDAPEGDSFDFLLQVASKLKADDADYFKAANGEDVLSESTGEVADALSLELTTATLEAVA